MRYRKACRAAISAKMTRGRSFSRWAPCPTALSCSTWADAWAQLRRSFALSTGALSEGTFMAYAIDNRRTGSAFLAVASTSVLLWFGTGLDPCWPLLWFAPLPLLHFATRSSWRSAAVAAASSWLLGSLNMWYYFHGLLHAPPAILAGIFAIPALMFRAGGVALPRAAAPWRMVERPASLPGDMGLFRIPGQPHVAPRHGGQSFL